MQLLLALTIAVPLLAFSAEIVVKPGKFDHFNISMPEKMVAGEEATIRLQAVDAFNNIISNFGEIEREFQISGSGSAIVKPSSFKASSFSNGALSFTIADRTAETFSLSIRETGSPIPIITKEISIVPNKLSSFVVRGPRTALAGEPFDIRLVAKDSFGNTVTEPIAGKNINLVFKGDADPKIDMPATPDFKGGVCVITLVSQKSGITQVEAKDLITGSMGASEKIDVINGPVASFKIFAPKEVIAGEPFELAIVAVDRYNNVVANYATTGSGVSITTSGKLKPFPSTIPAYEFVSGQAKVDLRYDVAEDITLTVNETGKGPKGSTEAIRVVSPVPERYEVTTPESVIAGQKFKLKITVYNQLGHVIKNYNLVGPDVQLGTTGTGTLVPNRIPSSEFVNGTAVVEVQYNKSEAFAIYASPVKAPAAPLGAQPPAVKKHAPAAEKQQPAAKAPAPSKPSKKSKKGKTKETAKEGAKRTKEAKSKHPHEITNISLVESKKKSTITIHIPNLDGSLKYNASTETIGGKKWAVVKVNPTVNKVEKSLKFESSFIGDVVVEEDAREKGAVEVKIELLKPARFHVAKEKNALSVILKP
ncbi:MAG TPA: hypothetical protein VF790_03695 [Dissulfurispiraceae bacterium]